MPVSISVCLKGNAPEYSVANLAVSDDPGILEGKTFFFLGSSVTYGYGSEGEAIPDFLAKADSCTCIKEAVSGTTLRDISKVYDGDSYVSRLEAYTASSERAASIDAFICQLSTNDMTDTDLFGTVSESTKSSSAFTDAEKQTTYGAIEYITALARETWNCPVVFYTSPNPNGTFNVPGYKTMTEGLAGIASVWDITVLDLYNDETGFNSITEDQYSLYMSDMIHPTKAGYSVWWLPRFENILKSVLSADGGAA